MLPMLQLAINGAKHRLSDANEALAAQFQLSDADRAELLPSGGQPRFVNKVGWARTHLGKALLLESPRPGWFCITARGRELLFDPPERITVVYLLIRSLNAVHKNATSTTGRPLRSSPYPGLRTPVQSRCAKSNRVVNLACIHEGMSRQSFSPK